MKKSRITILVPVYNEELLLEGNILRLKEFLDKNKVVYKLIIVDGNSTDKTPKIAKILAERNKNIYYTNTGIKGKGAQLKKAATSLKGDYFVFLDADLPIKLGEFMTIINSLMNGEADLVIASRHAQKREIKRPLIRAIASKLYSFTIRYIARMPVTDTIAGCKAWNRKIQRDIWPKIEDKRFFFDTELIYFANKYGFKIKEIPVSYFDRKNGSKFSVVRDGISIAINLIKLSFK